MTIADPPVPSALRADAEARPVRSDERLLTLDVLRGIALLGVLLANVWLWFSGLYFRAAEFRPELVRATLDSAAYHFIAVFVSGKAISTFSFLFGLGFAVQALRAEARGVRVAPIYRRRLGVLLAIGLAHGTLLWYGDILTAYALLGLVLLLFRRRRDRTLLVWAGVLLVGIPLAFGVLFMLMAAGGSLTPPADQAAQNAVMLEALRGGAPSRVVPVNLRMMAQGYLGPMGMQLFPNVLGLFLLGLWVGRQRVFENVSAHRAAFRRVMVWGFAVGIPANVVLEVARSTWSFQTAATRPWLFPVVTALQVLAVVPLAAAYVSAVVLLLERRPWRERLRAFAPVGRMALTNYLSQTVLCLLVFYGGGLVGRIDPAPAMGIALVIFLAQMAWSPWWLARFHFGPMEWLWRSLTYRRLQPMRVRAPAPEVKLAL